MKIILFIDSLGAGGAQRQLVGLAVMLQRHGYDVMVSTYYDIDFYKHYLDENSVPNEIIPCAANTKKRILAVRSYFKKENPDWVIAYQETPSLVACTCKVLGCRYKLIVSERNTTQVEGWNTKIRFFLYRVSDAIVPNSYAQEKYLAEHHPWMKKKLKTITNFADLEKFAFVPRAKRKVPLIVIAATLFESKNGLGFIEASRILKDKGVRFKAEWYGKIPDYQVYIDKCQQLIEKYELQNSISLCDKTKEIQKKYQECDFFCLPSFYEGTPNVICEAIASGRPVICSNVCDNPYYVKEGVNGCLFDPKNPSDMANTLEKALSISDVEYEKYCMSSRTIAEEKLSKNEFLNKYISIIKIND